MLAVKPNPRTLLTLATTVLPVLADSYANFFDDTECTVNGGIGVNLYNDGCLNEAGRGSVYIPHYQILFTGAETWAMCTYLEPDCPLGEAAGYKWFFTSTGFCALLDTPGAVSYRFLANGLGDC